MCPLGSWAPKKNPPDQIPGSSRERDRVQKGIKREQSEHTNNKPQQSFYKDRPVLGQDRQDRTCRDKGSPEGGG